MRTARPTRGRASFSWIRTLLSRRSASSRCRTLRRPRASFIHLPLQSGADLGINFPSVVLLLSPTEWDEVKTGQLPLPGGWDRSHLIEVSAS